MVNYKTSRDYKRLKELLDAGNEVVCFTTYDFNWTRKNEPDYKPLITTDICRAKFIKGSVSEQEDRYILGVRGCLYFEYWKNLCKWTFEEACEQAQIEFIEPTDPNIVLTKWSPQEEYCICQLESLVKEHWRNAEKVHNSVKIKKMTELMFFLKTLNPAKKKLREE